MKRLLILTVTLLGISLITPYSNAAPQFGRAQGDRVCFYQDIRYKGWEHCYAPGDELGDLRRDANNISSIRIFGRAAVIVFDSQDFRGASAEFYSDVPDLGLRNLSGSRSWSDRIESFRILGSGGNRGASNYPQPVRRDQEDIVRTIREGVCFYENANYRGHAECFDANDGDRDIGRLREMNDRISSIRLFGNVRVRVYRDVGLRGENILINGDVSDLAGMRVRDGLNWNDQISSFEIDDGRGRGQGRGQGQGQGRGRGRPDWR